MRIKVLMTDKATSRAVMDERERMLSAAVPAGTPAELGQPPARAEEPAFTSMLSLWPW